VIRWRNEFKPELKAEAIRAARWIGRLTTIRTLAAGGQADIHHEADARARKFIEAVSGGWPEGLVEPQVAA
jgi:hypothetical protein